MGKGEIAGNEQFLLIPQCFLPVLTLYGPSPGFYVSALQVFQKHCGKRRNCLLQAISPFPTLFSTLLENFLPYSSNLKSSAKSFCLEESKICHLGKGLCHFHQIQNVRMQRLPVWKSLKFVVWERVKGKSNMEKGEKITSIFSLAVMLSEDFFLMSWKSWDFCLFFVPLTLKWNKLFIKWQNFLPFQIERICRLQIRSNSKLKISLGRDRKHCGGKREIAGYHNVLKSLLS